MDDLEAARRAQAEKDAADTAAGAVLGDEGDGRGGSGDGSGAKTDGDGDGYDKNLLTDDADDAHDAHDADDKKKKRTGPLVPDTVIGKILAFCED